MEIEDTKQRELYNHNKEKRRAKVKDVLNIRE